MTGSIGSAAWSIANVPGVPSGGQSNSALARKRVGSSGTASPVTAKRRRRRNLSDGRRVPPWIACRPLQRCRWLAGFSGRPADSRPRLVALGRRRRVRGEQGGRLPEAGRSAASLAAATTCRFSFENSARSSSAAWDARARNGPGVARRRRRTPASAHPPATLVASPHRDRPEREKERDERETRGGRNPGERESRAEEGDDAKDGVEKSGEWYLPWFVLQI